MEISVKMDRNDMLCHFRSEDVDIISGDIKGGILTKTVGLKEFTSALSTSIKSVNVLKMDGFTLGANTVKFRVSEDGFAYYFLSLKGKYPINNNGKLMQIHYPNVLFKIVVDSSKNFVNSSIFSIKEEDIEAECAFGISSIKIKPEAKMYKYPFGNVNADGVVCWGGNRFSTLDTYQSIIEFVYSWYTTPSNGDYADFQFKDINRTKTFKRLKKEAFDENTLVITNHIFKNI